MISAQTSWTNSAECQF